MSDKGNQIRSPKHRWAHVMDPSGKAAVWVDFAIEKQLRDCTDCWAVGMLETGECSKCGGGGLLCAKCDKSYVSCMCRVV